MVAVKTGRPAATALAGALALVLAGSAVRAQDQTKPIPDDPVLQALVNEALDRNPDLLVARAVIAAARTRPEQARALPDPMVSMSYTNDGWVPSLGRMQMTNLALMAKQDLPWPGKRQLRADIAAQDAAEAEQQLVRARLAVTAGVRRAYYGLLLARELQVLTLGQRDLWRDLEVVVRGRYSVGQGAQQDVLRVQVEVTRIEQRMAEQAAAADVSLAELNGLLARPPEAPIETAAHLALRPIVRPLADVLDEARRASPELAAARVAIDRDRLAVKLAQQNGKPDLSAQVGYMNRGGLDAMWQAGVGVTLPFNRKARAAEIAGAEATVTGSERLLDSLDLQLRARTQERFTRAKSDETIVRLYDQGIVPQDRMTLEAAIVNYQSGKVPFVSVLEAMTTLYSDRWTQSELLADHATLLAAIEEASLASAAMGATTASMSAPSGPRATAAMGGGMAGRQGGTR